MSVLLVAFGLWAVSESKSEVAVSIHMFICLAASIIQIVYFSLAWSIDSTAYAQTAWTTSGLAAFATLQSSKSVPPKWPDPTALANHVYSNILSTALFGIFSMAITLLALVHSVRSEKKFGFLLPSWVERNFNKHKPCASQQLTQAFYTVTVVKASRLNKLMGSTARERGAE